MITDAERKKRAEFLRVFEADQAIELKELERLRGLIKAIEEETCIVFKTRLNKRRNKSLVVKSGNLYTKIEVLVDSKFDTKSVTGYDKDDYDKSYEGVSEDIKTPRELALFLGIDADDYDTSKRIKAY